MKILKPIVYEIINIKKELLDENHSPTVKKALELTIDQMYKSGHIDYDTQINIKDSRINEDEMLEFLSSNDSFKKSKEELEIEYLEFGKIITEDLINLGVESESFAYKADVDSESINICKIFSLEKEFLKNFFYLKNEDSDDYLDKLMKRKGFIERFAILRLPRILFDFVDICETSSNFSLEKTYPYFDSNKNCYSIDLVFNIKIDKITEDVRSEVLEEIVCIMNSADEYYKERMFT